MHTVYNQYQLCMKQYDTIAPNEVESKNGARILSYRCHIDSASS